MVEAVRKWLADQGVTPANFYFEKFSPSGAVTAIGEAIGSQMTERRRFEGKAAVVTGRRRESAGPSP